MRTRVVLSLQFVLAVLFAPAFTFHPSIMAGAATYYVATTGNDANTGTATAPWRTIQKAANTVVAGDTVVIGAGVYQQNVTITRSGTASAPITFLGQTSPTIVTSTPTTTACLSAANACLLGTLSIPGSYIKFNSMEVAGSPVKPGTIAGITLTGTHIEIASGFIHNTWREGIRILGGSYDHLAYNTITYAVIAGIYFDGTNHLIEHNTITHSVTRGPDRIKLSGSTDADGIRFFGTGTLVQSNVIRDIYLDESPEEDGPHSDCFQSWKNVHNITLDGNYCELENSTTYLHPYVKFLMLETPLTTTNNVSGLTVVNNIFVSKSVSTLWTPMQLGNNSCSASYPLRNLTIVNNTFVRPDDRVGTFAILMRCANGVSIQNNAIRNFGNSNYSYIYQDKNNNVGVSIDHNSVYNSTGVAPKGGPYSGDNIAAIWMRNPLFVSMADFRLQANSPLRDAGADLPAVTEQDFAGMARPQCAHYDIGAYEMACP